MHWPFLEWFSCFYFEDGVNFKSARSIRHLHSLAFDAHGPELEHREGTDERVENHKKKRFSARKNDAVKSKSFSCLSCAK